MSEETEPLRDKLGKAEHRLEAALGEVCTDGVGGSIRKPDTGELIRIDETLALASEAAKQAISLRRRMRADAKNNSKADAKNNAKDKRRSDEPASERAE
jgi:hypothetical protein